MADRIRYGFRLIDLMAVTLVVAIGLVLFMRYAPHARVTSRTTRCSNNMRLLGLALLNFSSSANRFPNAGTFHDAPAIHGGDPTTSNIYLAIVAPGQRPAAAASWLRSWVVDLLPYLDQPDLANAWDRSSPYWQPTETIAGQPSNLRISTTNLGILRCPVDEPASVEDGALSYVANGGFTRWPAIPVGWAGSPIDGQPGNGGIREWTPPGRPWRESQAIGKLLGVMFLGTETGDQPWDLATTPADLVDGASQTLLVGENTLAGFSTGNRYSGGRVTNWACPLPNFTMFVGSDDVCATARSRNDCLGGQLAPQPDGRDGPGWARANQAGTYENVKFGQELTTVGSFPFANSNHAWGVNFIFCDGSLRALSKTIDGTVYAKLITPAGGRLPTPLTQGTFADIKNVGEY